MDGRPGSLRKTLQPVPVEGGAGAAEAVARRVVEREGGMEDGENAELGEALEAAEGEVGVVQEEDQLVSEASAREALERPLGERHAQEAEGLGRDLEAEP